MARVLGSFSTMGIIRQAMGRRRFAAGTVAVIALLSMTGCDREGSSPDEVAAPAAAQAAEGPQQLESRRNRATTFEAGKTRSTNQSFVNSETCAFI